ncbi:hypothetical protein E3Q10_03650 [Wallemia mellicola]|uniref:Alpha-galactosidase n=1 Tax=Wallemia mellicola TaxID=1708541 RepID=A0A4T0QRY9_9BASI|nr:hypothetical protein E3Q11_03498 [Wallemia mellicola]TIC27615.1 hypothetical protein E3Q10_03650 [Wallemia mellicola]TIC72948.1 hypothetical protein E3Q00_03446 [Wallemia mellicola]
MFLRTLTTTALASLLGSVLALNNGVAVTPQMGWNSWNSFACEIDQDLITQSAQKLVDLGLRDLGYTYVGIDDCWQADARDPETNKLSYNAEKFPDGIKGVADQVHGLNLKLGIYSSAGTLTCGRMPASLGYETEDASSYAEWEVDLLKYDNCFNQGQSGTPKLSYDRYNAMSQALNATGRPIVYAMCNWGEDGPWNFATTIANSWRTTGDITDSFTGEDDRCPCKGNEGLDCKLAGYHCSITNILEKSVSLGQKSFSGAWNDLDGLEVGVGNLTATQSRSHFTMWAFMKSPLMIGANLETIDDESLEILKNKAVIDVNQDAGGDAAFRVWKREVGDGDVQLWLAELSDDNYAIAVLNTSSNEQTTDVQFDELFRGIDFKSGEREATWNITDLWQKDGENWGLNLGSVSGAIETRKKKIKCNGPAKHPDKCTNCTVSNTACLYNEPAPKRGFTVSYVRELERKVALYEALVEKLAPGRNLNEDVERASNSSPMFPPKRNYNSSSDMDRYSSASSTTIPMTNIMSRDPSMTTYREEPEQSDNSDDEMFESPAMGLHDDHDESSTDRMRYFGSVKGLLVKVKQYTGPSTPPLSTQQRPEYWNTHEKLEEDSYIEPYVNEDFGDERLYMLLVEIYFDKVNSTLPLLNKKRFVAEISQRKLERKFASILILVCALGALYCDDQRVLLPSREPFRFLAGSSFLATYKRKAPDYSLSAATLEDIQALILLQMFVQRSTHLKSSWNLNGAALVIAEDIGLHLQSALPDQSDRESRSRAMYCIYLFDRSLSAAYGRRILCKDEDLALELPKPLPEEIGSDEELAIIYFNHMVKLYGIQGQIMQQIYSLKKGNEKNDTHKSVASMSSKLNQWLDAVPEQLKYTERCCNNFIFQLASNLRIAHYNIQIFMYKNFVPHPHTKKLSKFKMQSLMICANAARSLLSIFNTMELKRSIVQNYIDVMLNLSPFNAIVILILSACESRRNGQDNQSDLEYIEIGVNILRRREIRDIVAGKSLDVILHLIKACQLRVNTTTKRRRSNDMYLATSSLKALTEIPSAQQTSDSTSPARDDQMLLNSMFNFMHSNPINAFDNGTENATFINSTPVDSADLEWSSFLSSVFQGS